MLLRNRALRWVPPLAPQITKLRDRIYFVAPPSRWRCYKAAWSWQRPDTLFNLVFKWLLFKWRFFDVFLASFWRPSSDGYQGGTLAMYTSPCRKGGPSGSRSPLRADNKIP